MKAHIDLEQTYKSLFLTSKRFKNRLIKYWGTESIDGVPVFKKQITVWPNTDSNKNVVKVLKMFGMYQNIKTAKFEGITRYYLWLNPNKSNVLADVTEDILVNKINLFLTIDKSFEVDLNFSDETDPTKFTGYTEQQIYDYVDVNYDTMIDSQYIEARGDTITQESIGLYVLLDDNQHFKVEVISAMVTPIAHTTQRNAAFNSSSTRTYYTSGISLKLKVTQLSNVTSSSTIIVKMKAENDQLKARQTAALAAQTADDAISDTHNWLSVLQNKNIGVTNSLWYKGQLRVETTDSSYLRRNKFAGLISSSIDTGYDKKKTSWWKKVLSIVIVVIAIVLAIPTGGISTAALGAFAINLGIVSLVLTVVQYVIAKSGDTGWAQYFGSIVQIVSVISMVTGIAAFIQNAGKNAFFKGLQESFTKDGLTGASKYLIKAAVTEVQTAAEGLKDNFIKLIHPASVSEILPTIGEIGSNRIVSIGSKVANMAMDQRVKSVQHDVSELSDKVAQSKKELNELTDREVNIGAEDLKFYTKPLTVDHTIFETDYLYEGTLMNIGRPSFYPTGLNIIDKA